VHAQRAQRAAPVTDQRHAEVAPLLAGQPGGAGVGRGVGDDERLAGRGRQQAQVVHVVVVEQGDTPGRGAEQATGEIGQPVEGRGSAQVVAGERGCRPGGPDVLRRREVGALRGHGRGRELTGHRDASLLGLGREGHPPPRAYRRPPGSTADRPDPSRSVPVTRAQLCDAARCRRAAGRVGGRRRAGTVPRVTTRDPAVHAPAGPEAAAEDDPARTDADGAAPVVSRHRRVPEESRRREAAVGEAFARVATLSLRFLLVVAGVVVLGYLAGQLWVIVLPVLLGLLLATVLWPPVRFLRDKGLPPAAAAGIVLLLSVLLLLGVVGGLAPQVTGQAQELADQVTAGLASCRRASPDRR
jgi:hypothetical protein